MANLWFRDGARYARVDAQVTPSGGLIVTRREMGAGPRDAWGEDDHQASLELTPQAAARLAMALLAERYADRPDALEALKGFCERHAVPVRYGVWT